MIPEIQFRPGGGQYARRLEVYNERAPAAQRAANRAMSSARTEAVRQLRPIYPGMLAGKLRARMTLVRATRARPGAALVFSGRRIKLYGNFSMRQVGKWGVRFRGLPWRLETISGEPVSSAMLERAFRQRSKGGRASVFSRLSAARESLEVLVAPGVARAVQELGLLDGLRDVARARYRVVLDQEMKFLLAKSLAKR